MSSIWWEYPLFYGKIFGAAFIGLTALNLMTRGRYSLIRENKQRTLISSRVTSMAHAIISIGLSTQVVFGETHWNYVNTDLQNIMLINTLGYMTYDLIYMYFLEPSFIFFIHHLVTVSYALTSYSLNLGGYTGCFTALFFELTNPVQLVWEYARREKLTRISNALSPILTGSFILFRTVILPPMYIYHCYWMWTHVPASKGVLCLWTGLFTTINAAGAYWSYKLYKGYVKSITQDKERENPVKVLLEEPFDEENEKVHSD